MKRVVTVGSAVVDILVQSDSFRVMKSHQVEGGIAMCEVYGGKIRAEEMVMTVGGGGTNVGLGLKRMGLLVKIMGVVGDDKWGEWIKEEMVKAGLETEGIKKLKGETAVSIILVAKDGGRSIITKRGVGEKLSSTSINWPLVGKADWVQVSSLGGRIDLLEDIVMYANSKGIKVGLNPGKRELEKGQRLVRLLPKVEFLTVNHMEAALFWKGRFGEDKIMAKKFLEAGVRIACITDGKKGAGIAAGKRWIKGSAFKTKSVDDTGAGDAFTAGVVAGLLKEESLENSLRMGLANGASVVTGFGAKDKLLKEREMRRWVEKKLEVVEDKL